MTTKSRTLPILSLANSAIGMPSTGKVVWARQMVWFVDVTVEKHPVSVATWGAPESPGDFCNRGGHQR